MTLLLKTGAHRPYNRETPERKEPTSVQSGRRFFLFLLHIFNFLYAFFNHLDFLEYLIKTFTLLFYNRRGRLGNEACVVKLLFKEFLINYGFLEVLVKTGKLTLKVNQFLHRHINRSGIGNNANCSLF